MSLLRSSLAGTRRVSAVANSIAVRHNSTKASAGKALAPTVGSTPLVEAEVSPADVSLNIDFATSQFSPYKKRHLADGSEPGEQLAAPSVSGAPKDLELRQVRIYRPTKPATQSGTWHQHHWRMDWDVLGKGHRWENPLMGWQSSADYMQGTRLLFHSKEDAIEFAETQGYEYYVQEPKDRKFTPKAYANNFLYSPTKLKHIRTK